MVLDEVLELDLVGWSELAELGDMFLLAVVAPATEPIARDGRHAEPDEAQRPIQLQDISRLWDTWAAARVLD